MHKKSLQPHKGFTLMEVMVAVSIFAIVVTVGIGALLTINNSYRKSQVSRQAIDSLTYILESMSRSLRTAREWDVSNSYDGTPTSSFVFRDQDGVLVTYRLASPDVYMDLDTDGVTGTALASGPYKLNPNNVAIDTFTFTAFGGNGKQSYLQINIAGTVTSGQQSSSFAYQTAVSKRSLDTVPVVQ